MEPIFKRVIKTEKSEAELLIYDAIEFLCTCKARGLGQRTDEFYFRLTLDELIENAMKHGNNYQYEKNITVAITASPEYMEVSVQDEGNGFSLEKVPHPKWEDKFKKSGRGIHLIQGFSEVTTNPKGNIIIAKL